MIWNLDISKPLPPPIYEQGTCGNSEFSSFSSLKFASKTYIEERGAEKFPEFKSLYMGVSSEYNIWVSQPIIYERGAQNFSKCHSPDIYANTSHREKKGVSQIWDLGDEVQDSKKT